ncbi:hypothetical protein LEP1GSC062_1590 [Leptospira alexanderi serovar Manhao 3 str. L 60]|uniref:Uncharacterized protein n=1 Tax=Leptospira alexanderi serovar Manhao 3 str. L 60 TaxID=1049759 RepID=V6HTU3_9LEPT|nr:hypothetical protein LEP1GSC062_1590 [Leptospira alexanderi serovar Manhao 3 str. L 60]
MEIPILNSFLFLSDNNFKILYNEKDENRQQYVATSLRLN